MLTYRLTRYFRRAAIVTMAIGMHAGGADTARAATTPPTTPPPARRDVVVDSAFGLRVEDPYRWMERAENPEFLTWMRAQGEATRRRLDALPGRSRLAARLRELSFETSGPYAVQRAGSMLFFMRVDTGSELPKLVVRRSDGSERVLVDPALGGDSSRTHVSVDNYSPSPDGSLVAYNLATAGSEISRVHVLDTATGRDRPDVIEHVWGEFAAQWLPDGSGFFYTQMAEEGFRDPNVDQILGMRVRRHLLGSRPEDDPLYLGPGSSESMKIEPREFPIIEIPRGSEYALAYAVGAGSELRLYVTPLRELRPKGTPWRRVAEREDGIQDLAVTSPDLYLLSSKGASNRRVLRVPLANPDLASAAEVVPPGERVLVGILAPKDGLYTVEMDAGVHRIFRYGQGRTTPDEIMLPVVGTVSDLKADVDREGILFSLQGWTQTRTYYEYLPGSSRLVDLDLRTLSPADYRDIAVERVQVRSFDGTMVPLTILHRKDVRPGKSHPTLLNGYGAYGNSLTPTFSSTRLAWLERGGVWALANVRGGGEKGEAWRLAGKGANKPNGVRDFIACAEYLVSAGYASPAKLAAMGSSGGGPLIGGAITRRPDLFGSAVLLSAILNPVRFLHGTNGANQLVELASPDTEEGFKALVAMDPTLSIRNGVEYPAVLLGIGLNDHRVSPWHSGKFAAQLLAAGGRAPVLVRVEPEAGHGVGSTRNQGTELMTDIYSFLLWRSGDPAFGLK